MSEGQILIFDCHGDAKPVICFNLEVGGFQMRVVVDEDEAVNLLDNARHTGENFTVLLVNNPYLNVDITKIVEDVQKINCEIPIVFVKDSENLKKIVEALSLENNTDRIYHTEPTKVVNLLARLTGSDSRRGNSGSSVLQAS